MRSCRFPWSRARTVAAELSVSFVVFRDGACRRVLSLGTHILEYFACLRLWLSGTQSLIISYVCHSCSVYPVHLRNAIILVPGSFHSASRRRLLSISRCKGFSGRERATKQVQICPASSWFLVASVLDALLSVSSSVSSVSCRFHAVFTRNRAIPSSWRTMFRNTLRILNLIVNPHPSFDIPPSFSEPFYYFNLYSSGSANMSCSPSHASHAASSFTSLLSAGSLAATQWAGRQIVRRLTPSKSPSTESFFSAMVTPTKATPRNVGDKMLHGSSSGHSTSPHMNSLRKRKGNSSIGAFETPSNSPWKLPLPSQQQPTVVEEPVYTALDQVRRSPIRASGFVH
ncbi:hypothetical protein PLICRDRAFT_377755 [Plicaturopsis crispa FD-325 SS-3]|nr:hypothetical protein PLICRDRAFT_377755 [Plicaturopsis crispa FD-325 SS-3]